MATMKYLNENNEWVDYVEKKSGLLVFDGENWVDGASDELAPPISASVYDGAKWVRFYPNAHITYQHKITGSGFKSTHAKNSSTAWTTSSPAYARGGTWTSNTPYVGWLGITKPSSIAGGVGSAEEIIDIKCNFTRYGIGYWEQPLKISLVPSTLTKASGTGTTAINSKRGSTIYSDTGMPICTALSEQIKGSTTFNNDNAKNEFKKFLNGSYGSILIGQKESTGDYIGLSEIELTFTYTCKVAKATFNTSDSPLLSHIRSNEYEMMIYENEVGLTYDEIVEKRLKNDIKDIKEEDVIFN